jgi:hypothetical protein
MNTSTTTDKPAPQIGESVKVHLPSESPWADCVATNADGSWIGEIHNDLVNTRNHGLKFGDRVRFIRDPDPTLPIWVAAFLTNKDGSWLPVITTLPHKVRFDAALAMRAAMKEAEEATVRLGRAIAELEKGS